MPCVVFPFCLSMQTQPQALPYLGVCITGAVFPNLHCGKCKGRYSTLFSKKLFYKKILAFDDFFFFVYCFVTSISSVSSQRKKSKTCDHYCRSCNLLLLECAVGCFLFSEKVKKMGITKRNQANR